MAHTKFPSDVAPKLKSYVYRLVDPITKKTFYVGKGKGDRVFQHAKGKFKEKDDDSMSSKLEKIRSIINRGLFIQYEIHRHGMTDDVAFEVEAALIDEYPNLTNAQGGYKNSVRGRMTVDQIIELYRREEAVVRHKVIIIDVSRSFGRKHSTRSSLYDAVRFMWRLDLSRAEKCEFVLAQRRGMIIGVFEPLKWLEATLGNFPEFGPMIRRLMREGWPKRIGFVGKQVTDPAILKRYLDKRVPAKYRTAPRAPCRYVGI